MEAFTDRPYVEQIDRTRVKDLLLAYRAATRVDVYPTVWRLRLLLTSRVWRPDHDTRIWEDSAGNTIGFAMLWSRSRDDTTRILDQRVHPLHATDALADAILRWALRRVQAIAAEHAALITLTTHALDPAIRIDTPFEPHGFARTGPDAGVSNVYLACSLQDALPPPALPAGFMIRPLRGIDEVDAYHGFYGFAPVSTEHRRALLLMRDEYHHFVVVDPAGALAAYCECSICRKEWRLSGRQIGWIDYIGTRPAYQRQGLGRAILLAALQQLRQWAADTAMLLTISSNTPALRLYRTAGFTGVDVPEASSYSKRVIG